jgi:hypothetical protein
VLAGVTFEDRLIDRDGQSVPVHPGSHGFVIDRIIIAESIPELALELAHKEIFEKKGHENPASNQENEECDEKPFKEFPERFNFKVKHVFSKQENRSIKDKLLMERNFTFFRFFVSGK